MATRDEPNPTWQLHAAIAGWLLPGLGHIVIGQRKRGLILMITISAIWIAGVGFGGISAIERRQPPENGQRRFSAWYLGQAIIAPTLLVDWQLSKMQALHGNDHPRLDDKPSYEPSYGKVNEQGVLYTALAGLLNLLAILDVMYCDPKYRQLRDATKLVSPDEAEEARATNATPPTNEGPVTDRPVTDASPSNRTVPKRAALAGGEL